MLVAQSVIEALAQRIELAYRRRHPGWRGGYSTPRLWSSAAEMLINAGGDDDRLPLDPELYVAAQPCESPFVDPWADLTGRDAVDRYRARIDQIVGRLREELAGEIAYAERKLRGGEPIARVLARRSRRLSPLGRYLVARRAGRSSLASRFLEGALEQHRSCPLYRRACKDLLPDGLYPRPEPRRLAGPLATASPARPEGSFRGN